VTRFRTLRGRLTAVAVLVAAVSIAALTIAFNVLLAASLRGDADTRLRAKASGATALVTPGPHGLQVRESTDEAAVDQQVWIYSGTRAVARPAAGRQLQLAADALAGGRRVFQDIAGREYRLYATPLVDDRRRIGTVVAGTSMAPYDRTIDIALVASVGLAVVLLAAVLVLTWASIGRALAPVREMTRSAGEWSENEPGRRFGVEGRPDELGQLARTFDSLLDRVAASLRHEQRLSAELSHELRTPLARIVAEVELLQRRERSPEARAEAYRSLARSAEQMSAILETLLAAARADADLGLGRSDLGAVLRELRRTWEPSFAERHLALDVQAPRAPLIAGVDEDVVQRIVAPVLENAARYARSRVVVDAAPEGEAVVLTVADDGPGVPAADRERVFEPGARLGNGDGHHGAGLGLALARRLARAAHGDLVVAAPSAGDGAAFRITLPS
jgi:signal transduction histidine kinase